jgi:hypothetical protein
LDGKLPDKVNNVPTVMEKSSGNKDNENHSKANSLIEFPEGLNIKKTTYDDWQIKFLRWIRI